MEFVDVEERVSYWQSRNVLKKLKQVLLRIDKAVLDFSVIYSPPLYRFSLRFSNEFLPNIFAL